MQLVQRHSIKPIERPALPLLPPLVCPQIVEAIASSADIDAERMSFARGSLSWPEDLSQLPLLVRHDAGRPAGRILDLRLDSNGRLCIRAQVDDPEARRMSGISIAATVSESEVHNEDSASGFYFRITKARIDEISLTDRPANANALVTFRRDITTMDCSHDDVAAAVARAQATIENLKKAWSADVSGLIVDEGGLSSRQTDLAFKIGPAPVMIYGDVPFALLSRPRTQFGPVAQLGGDR
jgi:hypothetical protein